MRDRRVGLARAGTLTLVATLVSAVGAALALAQNAPPKANPTAKTARNTKGAAPGQGAGAAAPAPAQNAAPRAPGAVDPLPDAQNKAWAPATFHYTLKLNVNENTALAASYYPSKLGTNASVVMLIHEKERSSKDFEAPITELKGGEGLAEYLQGQGHAVLTFDLRGHGANMRRPLAPADWQAMIYDVQAAYWFLVDRTNRGELNLSKLAVLGLSEGANLAAAWACQPAAAISGERRLPDLSALILISPMADGEGLLLSRAASTLAPRFPLLVMVGDRDAASSPPVRTIRPIVENPLYKQNKVELFDTSLHGYKLLLLEQKMISVITRFLEGTAKYKAVEWEPRYNLAPISFKDVEIVRNTRADAAKAAQAPAPAPAPGAAREKPDAAAK